ncbi:hypothetical protein HHI36_002693 [Cryptolaemus montrouzieri]|uniref:Uncharacterized protein n=1 Tax=Cryptolaemus montrouzieri TaxID=559131 RepID=A0ABD2PB75_9CUCU
MLIKNQNKENQQLKETDKREARGNINEKEKLEKVKKGYDDDYFVSFEVSITMEIHKVVNGSNIFCSKTGPKQDVSKPISHHSIIRIVIQKINTDVCSFGSYVCGIVSNP